MKSRFGVVGLFGLGTYAVWYLTPRAEVAVVTPAGTPEPGGKVVVPLANYTFVPNDLTVPVGLSQPTVSHHMRQLVDAGLVTREQRGKWAYYRLGGDAFTSIAQALSPSA